jgi:hypothetical protein
MSVIGCCESSTRLGGSTTSATSRPAACSVKTASRETEWEREDVEQSTRGFICWCADQLAETAGLAIELATVLCAEVEDHKSRLFKEFAGVDAFPLCLAIKDPDSIIG